MANVWIWYNCPEFQGGTREIRKEYFEHFPVPLANEHQSEILSLYTTERIRLTTISKQLISKFQRSLQSKFNQEDLPGKLQIWYLLSYARFISEMAKKKLKLSLKEEAEWEAFSLEETRLALDIKAEISNTENEIDLMVYALYGLMKEEIRILE